MALFAFPAQSTAEARSGGFGYAKLKQHQVD